MIVAGTVTDAELLFNVTAIPSAGAGADRVTAPVLVFEPTTAAGVNETPITSSFNAAVSILLNDASN